MSTKTWLVSDWHFNHDREFIWKVRGFENVQEMNEAIIERHNAIVRPGDIVYCLGDACLGGGTPEKLAANKALIERLNGNIIMLCGNHDTDSRIAMYQQCKNVIEAGKWADVIKYKGYSFYLSHHPTLTANLEKESLKQCLCNLYGHTHQSYDFYEDRPYMFHVGCDSTNCSPILLDDIIDKMNNKVRECLEEL